MSEIKNLNEVIKNTTYTPYDTNLPDVFNQIKQIIQNKLPDVDVEHVGSSSITGIGGRNAIDIAIPADEIEHESIKSKLYEIGFNDSPWQHYIPLLVGTIDYQNKNYKILLYVISPESPVFKGWIMYRNYMRKHPEDAKQYDQVKQDVINSGSTATNDYQRDKTPFILSMIKKIQESQTT